MLKHNAKFLTILLSIPSDKVENWSYVRNEGASPNWKLGILSYEKIRTELEKGTGLKRMISPKGYIQEGMPANDTAAWIYTVKIPGSDCIISLMKHYVIDKDMDTSWDSKKSISRIAYGIVVSSDTFISHWRVYSIKEAIDRIKFWVGKLKGVKSQL